MRETESAQVPLLPNPPSFLVCDQEAHCPMESRGIHLRLCGKQIHVRKEPCFHPCEFRLRNRAMLGRVRDWELQTLPRDFGFLALKPSSLSGLLDYPASWTHTSASVLRHLFTALKIARGKQQFTQGNHSMWFSITVWVTPELGWCDSEWVLNANGDGAVASVYLYGFLITGTAFCLYLSLKFWSHEFPNYYFFYI